MTESQIPILLVDAGARALYDTDRHELRSLSSIASGQASRIVLTAALPLLLADYRERLVKAEAQLRGLIASGEGYGADRIAGKVEGVRLALSYLDEMTR